MPQKLTAPTTVTYKIEPATQDDAADRAYQEGMDLFRGIYIALIVCLVVCASSATLVTLAVASI